MRLFIAANLPPTVRDAVFGDVAPLRAATDAVRWTGAPALHVTLKFLGERTDGKVEPLGTVLVAVASQHEPFEVELTEIGAFPNFRRPRVVWLGMTGEATFRALAGDLDRALVPLGFEAERRPFQAHLTLGRVKRDMTAAERVALAKAAAVGRPRRGFAVHAVDLMRSEPGPGGSRYTVVAAAPLHARGT